MDDSICPPLHEGVNADKKDIIAMDRGGMPEQLSGEHQEAVSKVVGGLIAKRGYYSVIDELVAAVYNLGEISLADPDNSAKMRDFDMWAAAVREAIVKHHSENTFESQVTDWDRSVAKRMGILLD